MTILTALLRSTPAARRVRYRTRPAAYAALIAAWLIVGTIALGAGGMLVATFIIGTAMSAGEDLASIADADQEGRTR